MKKNMLLVFAHPDDESFSVGGTVAKYVSEGWRVDLICATRGEAGNSGSTGVKPGEELGSVRAKELEKAGEILGLTSITYLDYKDGGLKNLPPGELEDKIRRVMLELTPDIVITFEPNGVSNHPDHERLCISTTYAFQQYVATIKEVKDKQISSLNRPRHARDQWKISFAELVKQTDDPKLYYTCMPQRVVSYLREHEVIPAESFGKPWIGVNDKHITTVIDTHEFLETKARALNAHQTQSEDVERFIQPHSQYY
jgi:LmbE family N-acetylglucosaminyl deacetylase